MSERATAGSLNRRVEEAHAGFKFEELRAENEKAEKEMGGYESKEEWDDYDNEYIVLYDN
jgi:hypothetical protein